MSFISILKKIGGVVVTGEHIAAATGLGSLIPGFAVIDKVFQIIPQSIASNEVAAPQDKQGPLKLPMVVADFDAGLGLMREILDAKGQKLTYDEAALARAIAAQVTAFNEMATVKASFSITPK